MSFSTDDEISIAGTLHYFARKFGKQLGSQVNAYLLEHASPNWFQTLKRERKTAGQPYYDEISDPRFLLREAIDEDGIVHFGIPGFDSDWKNSAAFLRRKLNSWYHASTQPTISNLIQIIEPLRHLSEKSRLPVEVEARLLLNQARAAQSGKNSGTLQASHVKVAEFSETVSKKILEKRAEIAKRPPVGSIWTGPRGTRKIVISRKLNDVTENGISIKNQIGANPDEVLESWFRYYPLGGEAKVADDGAVMGFKLGEAYLIGWLGDAPFRKDADSVFGFVLPHEYIFVGKNVRDLSTGRLLVSDAKEDVSKVIESLNEKLKLGDIFTATPYGELVIEADDEGPQLLMTVHKDIWFKGHLPG